MQAWRVVMWSLGGGWAVSGCTVALSPAPEEAPAPLRVDRLTPSEGPAAGGTEVLVAGAGFAEGTQVFFDDVPVPMVRTSDTLLTLTTPVWEQPLSGTVTVTVQLGEETVELPRGFAYTVPEDTGAPVEDFTGYTSGIVEVGHTQIACPICLEGRDPAVNKTASAVAVFHAPRIGSWNGWFPPPGNCERDLVAENPAVDVRDVGERVRIDGQSASLTLTKTSFPGLDVAYEDANVPPSEVEDLRGNEADVTLSSPTEGFPDVMEDAVVFAQAFGSIQPVELTDVPQGNSLPYEPWLSASGQTIQW